MRTHTQQLRQVLARGGFDSRWVCDVFYDGVRQMQDVDLEDVKFTEDGTAKVQQSGSLEIIYQGSHGDSIAPRGVEDILSPFGTALALYMLISDGPQFEARVPMGTFVVSDTPTIESVRWTFRGNSLTRGDRIVVSFKDPFYKVLRNRFDVPGVTPSLSSTYAEIQRLTRLTVTRALEVPDKPIPRALVYEEDRLDAVYELAKAVDAIPYMRADGSLSLRPNAWGAPVDTISAANANPERREITPEDRTGWTERARNHFTHPSFELPGPPVEVRRNRFKQPIPATAAMYVGSRANVTFATDPAGNYARATTVDTSGAVYYNLTAVANRVPATPGEQVQYRMQVRNGAGSGGAYLRMFALDSAGNYIGAVGADSPLYTGAGWGDIEITRTAPAGAASVGVYVLMASGQPMGATLDLRKVYAGTPTPYYFDGSASPDIDLTASWVGTVNASESILTGITVAGVVASGCLAIRSTQWVKSGQYSLRLIPTNASSNVTYAYLAVPAALTASGTALVTFRQEGALTGTLWAQRGRPYTVAPMTQPAQAPNAEGETELRWSWTGLTSTTLALPHGGMAGSGDVWYDALMLAQGVYSGPYRDGSQNPGGGLERTRWLGTPDASVSVYETREIVPAVYAPTPPQQGTLIRVKRGMTAEGVYNRVVVRASGQQAGVLAAGEIDDGPLRASNTGGLDSPFGRVPYFLSSQYVTTAVQAEAEVRKWLPRVSRPQAVVLDIEEIVNPLREVGDVVMIKRLGEEFPGRVVKVQRSKAKTQTTSVLVVPSGA